MTRWSLLEIKKRWKEAILECMRRSGGRLIALQDIYFCMNKNSLVTDYHREFWKDTGQERYKHAIRSYLSDLMEEGKVQRPKRGFYSLSN